MTDPSEAETLARPPAPGHDAAPRDEAVVGDEIELKLAADPRSLAQLRRRPFWKSLGPARTKRLESTYFDTQELDLQRAGLTLRVRRTGRRFEQTVKSARKADDALARTEWTARLATPAPDLLAFSDPALIDRLGAILARPLRPVFTTRVRRTTRMLEDGETTAIEVAVDQGDLVSGDLSQPINEVELELKRGEVATLFDAAERLLDDVPLPLLVDSKSERGYALAGGGPAPWRKQTPLDLDRAMTAESALGAIIDNCLAHLLANADCARRNAHVEGVHQVRVALRRLRSALSVFAPLLPTAQTEALRGELGWLASTLGPARDWDVFATELLPDLDGRVADATAAELRRLVETERAAAYREVASALASERFARVLLTLSRWRSTRAWRDQPLSEEASQLFQPVTGLSTPLLQKRDRQVRKRGRHLAHLAVEERHALRIALKKLRYATDFFAGLYRGKEVKRYLKRLARLQDILGHLNDVAQVERLSRSLSERGASRDARAALAFLSGWHARGVHDLEPDLHRAWRRFGDEARFWR